MKFIHVIPAMTFALAVSGCGKVNEAVQNIQEAAQSADLQGKWTEQACNHPGLLKPMSGSKKTAISFAGATVTRTEMFYADKDCSQLEATWVYTGTFDKKDAIQKDVYAIDLHLTAVTVMPMTDGIVKALNDTSFCGRKGWVANQGYEMTGFAAKALCPLDDMPQHTLNIYTVQNNALFLGRDGFTSNENRPDAIDYDRAFHRE